MILCNPVTAKLVVRCPSHSHRIGCSSARCSAAVARTSQVSLTSNDLKVECSASTSTSTSTQTLSTGRRAFLVTGCLLPGAHLLFANSAAASKLPALADRAWEALGGGPADLYFPDHFEGVWQVTSTLVNLELPLGVEMVPDMKIVDRARRDDLNKAMTYQVAYVRNSQGRLVYDRRFNTIAMLSMYYNNGVDFSRRIEWEINDPNVLKLTVPGGMEVRTRVTRRSQSAPAPDRIETSEYYEQVFDGGAYASNQPKIKASQCFTKYKWRDAAAVAAATASSMRTNPGAMSSAPTIVATQVVSDYLTPYNGEEMYLQAMNRPVITYTYRMSFTRAAKPLVEQVAADAASNKGTAQAV